MSDPGEKNISQDELDRERSIRIKTAIGIFAMMGLLLAGILVAIGFMLNYSIRFYEQMSSGQDELCNFYTCSNSSECGKYPKIIFPDGTEKCLTD